MKNHRKFFAAVGAAVALSVALISVPARADDLTGTFDPCVEMRTDFRAARNDAIANVDAEIAAIATAAVPEEFAEAWRAAKREKLRPLFDQSDVGKALKRRGITDVEQDFKAWFNDHLAEVDVAEIIKANYLFNETLRLNRVKGLTENEFDGQKRELDKACKKDFGSTALRVALNAAMKPLDQFKRNLKAGEKDGVINQVIQAQTGVNVVDAVRCPVRGCSDKSVVNQAAKSVKRFIKKL